SSCSPTTTTPPTSPTPADGRTQAASSQPSPTSSARHQAGTEAVTGVAAASGARPERPDRPARFAAASVVCRDDGLRCDVTTARHDRGVTYRERPTAVPGVVLWQRTSQGRSRIMPDGCLDLVWDGRELFVAGPDTAARWHDCT